MSRQSLEPPKGMNRASPLRGTLAALGIGGAAQYALTHGFPLLGMVGYGIAIWLFVSRLGRYQAHDSLEEVQSLNRKLLQEEVSGMIDTFALIKNNWRQMTFSEIFSGSFKSPIDHDVIQHTPRVDDYDRPDD